MKYWILLLSTVSGLIGNDYKFIFNSGMPENRCDIVFLVKTEEVINAEKKVGDIWKDTCSVYPLFKRYKNFFNVHLVKSSELFDDLPKTNMSKWWNNDILMARYFADLNASFSGRDIGVLLRENIESLKGSYQGGAYAAARLCFIKEYTSSTFRLFAHEMGHTLGHLSDEYAMRYNYTGRYPANIILKEDSDIFTGREGRFTFSMNKWVRWQGYVDPISKIAIDGPHMQYKGKDYPGSSLYYRPSSHNTIMNNQNVQNAFYDAVAREHMILSIYDFCKVIDSASDNNITVNGSDILEVNVIDEDIIDVVWKLNGEPISNKKYLILKDLNLSKDSNLTLTAWDTALNTDYKTDDRGGWVRKDSKNKLIQTIEYKFDPASEVKKWYECMPIVRGEWRKSCWFGHFMALDNGWVYHETLKWVYGAASGSGVWFFIADEGWLWTSPELFPYFYSNNERKWLMFN